MEQAPSYRMRTGLILFVCLAYLLFQLIMIAQAHFSDDKRFGFWMFAEATMFQAQLYRETSDKRKVYARNGYWRVLKEDGRWKKYSWKKMVRSFRLSRLDEVVRAKVSFLTTIRYMQEALDYVAKNTLEDTETKHFVMEVNYRRAGRTWQHLTLRSIDREHL